MGRNWQVRSVSCIAAGLIAVSAPGRAGAQPASPLLKDLGPAPELAGIKGWLNGGPLTIAGLRGKVVLINFWAYSCINCIRTLPYLEKWQGAYGKQGLVVIGVHAPEFRFETNPQNIQSAITRFGINYPVAEDNDLLTWNAFHNQYWPAEYLIDRYGQIAYTHVGEGEYDVTENAIRTLVGVGSPVAAENGADLSRIGSPEMYFGLQRVAMLASPEPPGLGERSYTAPAHLALNRFALAGRWMLSGETATLAQPGGRILLRCRSGKIFMVASSPNPVTVDVTVDGKPAPR